ncbi:hypothetical protein MferCBS31731_004343 [Microsporum ferrugineum]
MARFPHGIILSIWADSSEEWKAALSASEYIDEYQYLMTVPLAKDGGMTQWVLIDKALPENQRTILASCETFRKSSLTQGLDGTVKDTIIHGVSSLYCEPKYRGRGYASRLLDELSQLLPSWQTDGRECVASILFFDIGGDFYGNRGWRPYPSHNVGFDPAFVQIPSTKPILTTDLDPLCILDEQLVRKSVAAAGPGRLRHTIIPDVDHILWHGCREKFACEKLFGKVPDIKGAVIGDLGNRVWVLWKHRFVGTPGDKEAANTLYILVVENQTVLRSFSTVPAQLVALSEEQEFLVQYVRDTIQAARNEAAEWKLNSVAIWDPSAQVQNLIQRAQIPHRKETRLDNKICCFNWLRKGEDKEATVEWVAIEKYCWC